MSSGSGSSPLGESTHHSLTASPVEGADDGRAHDEAVGGEKSCGVGEEASAVAVDDVDPMGSTQSRRR